MPLHLLDANIPQNNPDDRKITAQLYGGDQDMRVRQELLLGVGGLRALKALGVEPDVCHMNEGHSAFLAIERVARTMEKHNIEFAAAKQIVAAGNVFTTHTPVEAGNDMFPPYLVESYLDPFLKRLKVDKDELIGLGRQRPGDKSEPFCMTVLAIRLANHINGVSKLHGRVSRTWAQHLPELPKTTSPSNRSPTASTPRASSAPRCISFTIGISVPIGATGSLIRRVGRGRRRFPTPSCGAITNGVANGWSHSRAGEFGSNCKPGARPPLRLRSPTKCSTPKRLPSVSPGALPLTSGPPCCSAILID